MKILQKFCLSLLPLLILSLRVEAATFELDPSAGQSTSGTSISWQLNSSSKLLSDKANVVKKNNIGSETNSLTIGQIFVDGVTGSDSSGDGTASKPFATLTKGQQIAATNNYTVVGVQGTFNEGGLGTNSVGWYFYDGVRVTNAGALFIVAGSVTNLVIDGRGILISSTNFFINQTNAFLDLRFKTNSATTSMLDFRTGGNSNQVLIRADVIDAKYHYDTATPVTNLDVVAIATQKIYVWDQNLTEGSGAMGKTNRLFTYTAPYYYVGSGTTFGNNRFCWMTFNGGRFKRNGATWTGSSTATHMTFKGVTFDDSAADGPTLSWANMDGTWYVGQPVGVGWTAPATISVGASPYSYTNTTFQNQAVQTTGGTVSAITFNSVSIGANSTNCFIPLEPGDWLTVTYGSAPTMISKRIK